ncbi:restriction endonuclease subunit S [Dysgonomonas sp. 521]|uniref:restriction endonuclease subunit S n=1 Tax=Dysgonomonas sp. 521 TaxID=2302932 RepID=UPI0013D05481|nr:restriction endonuclease subunit S [Dysgonomonas sp. 521]
MKQDRKEKGNVPNLRFPEFTGEWETVTLGECSESLDYGMNTSATEYDGHNKYIRITDIDEASSKYLSDNPVSPDGELLDKYLVEDNDILFARTGASTGKTYIYDKIDGKLYFAGFLIRAKIKQEYNALFIFSQTQSTTYDKWVKLMSMRSGQPGINSQEYASYKICLPSRQEQDKIALFLSLINQRIETQNKIIEKLESLIKGLDNLLFCNRKSKPALRFPEYLESWRKSTLKEFTSRVTRKNKDNETQRALTIAAQYGLVDQISFFNKQVASNDMSNYYLLYNGEFAYNKSYSKDYPWGAVKRLDSHEKGALSTLYICFKPLDNVNSDYLVHYFESNKWYPAISEIAGEGARNHGLLNISIDAYFNTMHYIPSYEEQEKIASFLNLLCLKLEDEKTTLHLFEKQKLYFLRQMFI